MVAPKKRVLITGAAGTIGSSLAEQLKERYALCLHYYRTIPDQRPNEIAHWMLLSPATARR